MSRNEILAEYPGARWRDVNDSDREWCTSTGHPLPLGYVEVDVTIRRLADGAERVDTKSSFMVREEGDDGIRAAIDDAVYWWTDGNAGCDCNRELFFLRAGGEPEPDATSCGNERFKVVAPDWLR